MNPAWGLFNFASVEGKGGSDSEIDGRGKLVLMPCFPVFLLRTTETYPNKISSGCAYFFADAVKFIVGPVAAPSNPIHPLPLVKP